MAQGFLNIFRSEQALPHADAGMSTFSGFAGKCSLTALQGTGVESSVHVEAGSSWAGLQSALMWCSLIRLFPYVACQLRRQQVSLSRRTLAEFKTWRCSDSLPCSCNFLGTLCRDAGRVLCHSRADGITDAPLTR